YKDLTVVDLHIWTHPTTGRSALHLHYEIKENKTILISAHRWHAAAQMPYPTLPTSI
ncbi:hypothetical protein ACJX0J_022277, partial [Zea mays]